MLIRSLARLTQGGESKSIDQERGPMVSASSAPMAPLPRSNLEDLTVVYVAAEINGALRLADDSAERVGEKELINFVEDRLDEVGAPAVRPDGKSVLGNLSNGVARRVLQNQFTVVGMAEHQRDRGQGGGPCRAGASSAMNGVLVDVLHPKAPAVCPLVSEGAIWRQRGKRRDNLDATVGFPHRKSEAIFSNVTPIRQARPPPAIWRMAINPPTP